ncbi:hypothetical protein CKAN_00861300 [Cinnamomum micranthum f. kanehirae]|uniref:Uncharacterized protein n=1 Tax=Cinnamomum micranthum f. kanehirae TaxID=337451 RepID=A0A443NNC1_9MAGN|nr:hypothetical protein CKAN_00861300 [Cinnamomum micranthum f. kanehirae]
MFLSGLHTSSFLLLQRQRRAALAIANGILERSRVGIEKGRERERKGGGRRRRTEGIKRERKVDAARRLCCCCWIVVMMLLLLLDDRGGSTAPGSPCNKNGPHIWCVQKCLIYKGKGRRYFLRRLIFNVGPAAFEAECTQEAVGPQVEPEWQPNDVM